jgi:DNA-binding response OmpR family regulator
MHMITEEARPFHLRGAYRILYAGRELALLKYLREELADCAIVRCPNGTQARLFIERTGYSLLLFDEALPDTTGRELASFAGTLAKREGTPVVFTRPEDFASVACEVEGWLAESVLV